MCVKLKLFCYEYMRGKKLKEVKEDLGQSTDISLRTWDMNMKYVEQQC